MCIRPHAGTQHYSSCQHVTRFLQSRFPAEHRESAALAPDTTTCTRKAFNPSPVISAGWRAGYPGEVHWPGDYS
jgi:hypothetical protein